MIKINNNGDVVSLLSQASQAFDNIITVGLENPLKQASYSSYSYELDISASSGGTKNLEVTACVDVIAKTSVTAAKVTGIASLVWAANPQLSYRQVINILQSIATDVNKLG